MLWNALLSMKPVSLSKESQYLVSRHSLYEIDILAEKSAFEIVPLASATFEPIAVPLLKSCFESMHSSFSSRKNIYPLTIRMAKAYDFFVKIIF